MAAKITVLRLGMPPTFIRHELEKQNVCSRQFVSMRDCPLTKEWHDSTKSDEET
jgi:hypothetical protein